MHWTPEYNYCKSNPQLKTIADLFKTENMFSGVSPCAVSARAWAGTNSTVETRALNYLKGLPGEHKELNDFFYNLSLAISSVREFSTGWESGQAETHWKEMISHFQASEGMKARLDAYNRDHGYENMKDDGMQALYALLNSATDAVNEFDALAMVGQREKAAQEILEADIADNEYEKEYQALLEDADGFRVEILETKPTMAYFANSVKGYVDVRNQNNNDIKRLTEKAQEYSKKADQSRTLATQQRMLSEELFKKSQELNYKYTDQIDKDVEAEEALIETGNQLYDQIEDLDKDIAYYREKIGTDKQFNDRQNALKKQMKESLDKMPKEIREALKKNDAIYEQTNNFSIRLARLIERGELNGTTVDWQDGSFKVHGSEEGQQFVNDYRAFLTANAKGAIFGLRKGAEADKMLAALFEKSSNNMSKIENNAFTSLAADLKEKAAAYSAENARIMRTDFQHFAEYESAEDQIRLNIAHREEYLPHIAELEKKREDANTRLEDVKSQLASLRSVYDPEGTRSVAESREAHNDELYRTMKQAKETRERSDRLDLQEHYFRDMSALSLDNAAVAQAKFDYCKERVKEYSSALYPLKRIDDKYKALKDKELSLKTKRDTVKHNAETVLHNVDPRNDNVRDKLLDFQKTIDNGKDPGHKDTSEFTRMRSALNAAIEEKDPAAFGKKLQELTEASRFYIQKKEDQFRFDIFSSNMRYTRLSYAQNLMKFSENANRTLSIELKNKPLTEFIDKAAQKNSVELADRIAREQKITKERGFAYVKNNFEKISEEYKKPSHLEKITEATQKVNLRKAEMVQLYGPESVQNELQKEVDTRKETLSQTVPKAERSSLTIFSV